MKSSREIRSLARELGQRFAAAGALVAALVSLLQHAPVWVACLRGAATLFVLALGTRLGAAALARAVDCDRGAAAPVAQGSVRTEARP
jgi:hypothetical protein